MSFLSSSFFKFKKNYSCFFFVFMKYRIILSLLQRINGKNFVYFTQKTPTLRSLLLAA